MKGFVLTMDVAIAIVVAGFVLLLVPGIQANDAYPELESKRLASDIVAVLDYNGVLGTYDKDIIEANLSGMLPANINMSMTIKKFNSTSSVSQIQINAAITDNYMAGKWWFATDRGRFFYFVDYRVKFR